MTIYNILGVYSLATQGDIEAGKRWYQEAQKSAEGIALKYDVPARVVVGVIAALSPNNRWERNVADAEALVAAYVNGEGVESVAVATYSKMREKAWAILQDGPETDDDVKVILNGRKIVSFYGCIRGLDDVCIDGHAKNVAEGERVPLSSNATGMTKRQYEALQDEYREAASLIGLPPYVLQAVTWTVWRRIHNI